MESHWAHSVEHEPLALPKLGFLAFISSTRREERRINCTVVTEAGCLHVNLLIERMQGSRGKKKCPQFWNGREILLPASYMNVQYSLVKTTQRKGLFQASL